MSPLKRWTALLLLALLAGVNGARAATSAEDFLNVGIGPRPMALGNSYVGVADTIDALPYNPAGLALLPRQEAAFTHNAYVQGIAQDYAAYAYPAEWGALGVSANLLRVAPFDSYDANDTPLGSTSAEDLAVGAAYARSFGSLALGAQAKYLRSRLDTISTSGEALDVGALLSVTPRLRLGASALNAGPGMRFISESDPLPLTGKAGASYVMPLRLGDATLLLACDASLPRGRSPYASGGLELRPVRFAALRMGYQGGQDLGSGLTIGAGLDFTASGRVGLAVDYAFVNMGELGNANRIGLRLSFGAPVKGDDSARAPSRDGGDRYAWRAALKAGELAVARVRLRQALDADPSSRALEAPLRRLDSAAALAPRVTGEEAADDQERLGLAAFVEGRGREAVIALRRAFNERPQDDTLLSLVQLAERSVPGTTVTTRDGLYPGLSFAQQKVRRAQQEVLDGRYDEAIARCSEALEVDERDVKALEVLGSAYYLRGDRAQAKTAWSRALALDPGDSSVSRMLARLR